MVNKLIYKTYFKGINMIKKYNYIHIFLDIIKFKLKIRDVKKFKKISDICDKFEMHQASVSEIMSLTKYKPKDIINLINFHNKYIIGNENKINIQNILKNLYLNSNKYKEIISFNKIPIFEIIKNIETIINKK